MITFISSSTSQVRPVEVERLAHDNGLLGLETDDMVTEGVDPQTLMFIPNQAFDELDVEWMADAHEHFSQDD